MSDFLKLTRKDKDSLKFLIEENKIDCKKNLATAIRDAINRLKGRLIFEPKISQSDCFAFYKPPSTAQTIPPLFFKRLSPPHTSQARQRKMSPRLIKAYLLSYPRRPKVNRKFLENN